jgi:hypothetical protein
MGQEGRGRYLLALIKGGDPQATFRLDPGDEEDSIPRCALDAWLAEPDGTNGKTNKQRKILEPEFNNFLRKP